MADASLRSNFDDAEWEALKLSIVLVCRQGPGASGEEERWRALQAMLARLGARAASLDRGQDLALAVLADFAEASTCQDTIERARQLIARHPELALRRMTEGAGTIVDRGRPEQAFGFRATLVVVSMLAAAV